MSGIGQGLNILQWLFALVVSLLGGKAQPSLQFRTRLWPL
jgi:hypothetical protein